MTGESSQGFKVNITDLYMTAPAFKRAGGEIGDAAKKAASQLEALGSFWGNDETGEKFGSVYAPSQSKLLEALAMVAGKLDGVADGIDKTAEQYKVTEQQTITRVQSLNRELP